MHHPGYWSELSVSILVLKGTVQWWCKKGPNLEGGLGRLLHSAFPTHPPLLLSYPFSSFSFFFYPFPKKKKKRQTGLHASCYYRLRDLWDWCFGRLMVIWGVAVGLTKCLFFSSLFLSTPLSPFLPPSLSSNSSSKGTAGDVPIKHVPQGLLLQLAPLASNIHPDDIWSRRPVRLFLSLSFYTSCPLAEICFYFYLLSQSSSLTRTLPFSIPYLAGCLSLSLSVMWCLALCKKAACLNQWSMQSASPWWELIRPVWLGETELRFSAP